MSTPEVIETLIKHINRYDDLGQPERARVVSEVLGIEAVAMAKQAGEQDGFTKQRNKGESMETVTHATAVLPGRTTQRRRLSSHAGWACRFRIGRVYGI